MTDEIGPGCMIPMAQSALLGALAFALGISGASFTEDPQPWRWGMLAFSAVAFTWALTSLIAWRLTFYAPELPTVYDASQQPAPQVKTVIDGAISKNDGRTLAPYSLPMTEEQMIQLASGIVNERKGFTEATWVKRIFSTRDEFVAVRDALIQSHLAEWVSPVSTARGVRITEDGMEIMRHYAALASPTLQTNPIESDQPA